jgi:hypothetical protein
MSAPFKVNDPITHINTRVKQNVSKPSLEKSVILKRLPCDQTVVSALEELFQLSIGCVFDTVQGFAAIDRILQSSSSEFSCSLALRPESPPLVAAAGLRRRALWAPRQV